MGFFDHPDAAAKLPEGLRPLAAALDLVTAHPEANRGWMAHGYPEARPAPLRIGAPPYDGVYRGSWISPGVCLRLDLAHPCVPERLRERLRAQFSVEIGTDGALYVFGVDSSSQHGNRAAALDGLLAMVRVR